jgi:hypothetical protein
VAHEEVVDTDQSDLPTPEDGDTNDSEEEKELVDALAIGPGTLGAGSSLIYLEVGFRCAIL